MIDVWQFKEMYVLVFKHRWYIHLYSPYNMVAQANNTGTSKNTTNEKDKNNDSSTLHINYVALNSQYPLQMLPHVNVGMWMTVMIMMMMMMILSMQACYPATPARLWLLWSQAAAAAALTALSHITSPQQTLHHQSSIIFPPLPAASTSTIPTPWRHTTRTSPA